MHRHKFSAPAFSSLSQFVVAVAILPFALIHGMSFAGFGHVLPFIVLSSLAFGAGSIMYYKTLRIVEASMLSILFATSSFWIMAIGIVILGEHLSILQIFGTVMVFGSVALLIKNIRDFRFDKGIVFGLATGLLYGIAIASSAFVARKVDIPTWAFVSFLTGGLLRSVLCPAPFANTLLCYNGGIYPPSGYSAHCMLQEMLRYHMPTSSVHSAWFHPCDKRA